MATALQNLVSISRHYGVNSDYVIAGGGNTSYKNDKLLYVKASGVSLATVTEDGFAVLNRQKLKSMRPKRYSSNPFQREREIKNDLAAARAHPDSTLRPSVEASLHDLIDYRYVVHTHPTIVNALMCSKRAASAATLFPDALFIPYTDPGYTLSKKVESALVAYRARHRQHPPIIFLDNHGVFVGADTVPEIRKIMDRIVTVLSSAMKASPTLEPLPMDDATALTLLPAVRMLLSEETVKVIATRNNPLIQAFARNAAAFKVIADPFTPDCIVYCKSQVLYSAGGSPDAVVAGLARSIPAFRKKHGYMPKVILIKDFGMIGADDTARGAETALAVFEDAMKIAAGAESFGGAQPMTRKAVAFIDSWEVENYRRAVARSGASGRALNKIAVVTGAAQGFGEGIAQSLFDHGANVVIADLNEEKGRSLAGRLNALLKPNRALFVKTDVSSSESVSHMTAETVRQFGGLDVLVSNAGVLRAGGLDEMDAKTFDFMTRINYSGYFLCAKYASAVMKTQQVHRPGHFADIIQINSKSGLEGSNRNFAYAGGKFGGIGLTQSFALELMPHNIKVNSICPGNFFDGPLWSDPANGLFVQYLKAKKVPGAKTVADVKKFYENKVPAGRGCTVPDVMKAIFYIIEQEYETGQAVPVTGGQVMLK